MLRSSVRPELTMRFPGRWLAWSRLFREGRGRRAGQTSGPREARSRAMPADSHIPSRVVSEKLAASRGVGPCFLAEGEWGKDQMPVLDGEASECRTGKARLTLVRLVAVAIDGRGSIGQQRARRTSQRDVMIRTIHLRSGMPTRLRTEGEGGDDEGRGQLGRSRPSVGPSEHSHLL